MTTDEKCVMGDVECVMSSVCGRLMAWWGVGHDGK